MIGRAIETLTKRHCGQGELWRLREAVPCWKAATRALGEPDPELACACVSCHASKPVWAGLVADAGQMFESIPASEVAAAFDAICDLAARDSGQSTTTVLKSRQRRAFAGGAAVTRPGASMTFSFEELKGCLKGFLCMDKCAAGDAVASMRGIPIGGFLSKAAASVRLCVAEHRWAQGFGGPVPWREAVAARRYVDDLLMTSHRYCRACLEKFVGQIYPIRFDISPAASQLKWLDIVCDVTTQTHDMLEKPYSTPPAWATTASAFHGYVMGRAARWKELELSRRQLVRQAARLTLDLRGCGWPRAVFRQVYYALDGRDRDDVVVVLRAALLQVFRPSLTREGLQD
jgi:hypothetical protein